MKELTKENECIRGKTTFSNGTRLCLMNKCMTCRDGKWEVKKN